MKARASAGWLGDLSSLGFDADSSKSQLLVKASKFHIPDTIHALDCFRANLRRVRFNCLVSPQVVT